MTYSLVVEVDLKHPLVILMTSIATVLRFDGSVYITELFTMNPYVYQDIINAL